MGPSLRRGLYAAIPAGLAILVELELDLGAAGAVASGSLIAGFVGFDAPARVRLAWQLAAAPAIGVAAGIGALTSETAWLAVLAMAIVATLAGLMFAVSPRLSVVGVTCVLALLLSQGLAPGPSETPQILVLGAAGIALQALFTLARATRPDTLADTDPWPGARAAAGAIAAGIGARSVALRHALRWGTALAIATASYHVIDLGAHGYWVPLTVLFVLRPTPGETTERTAMRAVGTMAGLLIATPLALALGGHDLLEAAVLAITIGFSFALLAIEYALFTTSITTFIVVFAHALGQPAGAAADERAIATALGIAIAALAIAVWGNPKRVVRR